MTRLITVSNRLPVTVRVRGPSGEVTPSTGGLAVGLRSLHAEGESVWVGWPGDLPQDATRSREILERMRALSLIPVPLTRGEVERFYEGAANGVLWPLFHYLLERLPRDSRDLEAYRAVNERFAEAVAAEYRDGDMVWVHDYHLMLLPGMLRARLPSATIGFFLHIPFPSSEVFRILPWRRQILEGLLGADVIGFHTYDYLRHYSSSLLRLLGIEARVDRVEYEGRTIRLGVFPMGIDVASWSRLSLDPDVAAQAERIRSAHRIEKLVLGVDRLDYTKGVLRRLLGFERLLERSPEWRGRVRYMQIAVPSRERVEAYKTLRREVEQEVGRINGLFATLSGAPVHYVYRAQPESSVAAAYRAADVMAVTPLRDGMNLVAKEYVAARGDGDGALVLSEFAGAASELGEALQVNPYSGAAIAEALDRALRMEEPERRRRMAAMRERVLARPIELWARSFVDALAMRTLDSGSRLLTRGDLPRLASELAGRVVLILDYDGTLVPLRRLPSDATPDPELLELLTRLGASENVALHVVSGRPRGVLDDWLGGCGIGIHAEHGLYSKMVPGEPWTPNANVDTESWRPLVRPIFEEWCSRIPGSFVEEKVVALAWHYRAAEPPGTLVQSRELVLHLVESLAQLPVTVVVGNKVVEVRAVGVTKALAVRRIVASTPGYRVVAAGDDRTDEDLFASLPNGSIAIAVGAHRPGALVRVGGTEDIRALLRSIAEHRSTRTGS